MSHRHGKHKAHAPAPHPRGKEAPIGMVKQRAGLATALAMWVVLLFALGVAAVVVWLIFG
ncbi:MAG: hypothetical protein K2Q09_05705 [Phycisphaerales bacterium]|nr:hypothetical protein [Phycisphaerales bacterium]